VSIFRLSERIFLTAAAAIGAVFLILRFGEFPVGAGMDDAYYIEMARSLADGRGPVIHLNQVVPGWWPNIFPLGFPLLLSPVAYLVADSVQLFKLIPILAWIALALVCLRLARTLAPGQCVALAALVCLNPWTIAYAVRVFSDLPFAAVSLAAVMMFTDLADLPRMRTQRFAALVVVTAAAIMIRSVGLALPVSMIFFWLLHRRWLRAFLLAGSVAAVLLPITLACGQLGGGLLSRSYLQQVFASDAAGVSRTTVVMENLTGYLRELSVVLLPLFGNPLESLAARYGLGAIYGPMQMLVGIVLVAGIIRGLIVLGRGHPGRSRFLFIYLVVYSGVLLNFSGYPSGVQARLLLPVVPLLYLMLLVTLQRMAGTGRVFWTTVALVFSLSLGHNGYRAARPVSLTPEAGGQVVLDPGLGTEWIRNNTEPDDLVMVRWPLRQHIHFLRPVVGYGTVGRGELDQRIQTFGVEYIFLGPGPDLAVTTSLLALLEADPDRFELVHRDREKDFVVFKVVQGP
jgi:hypothetical protein